MTTVSPDPTPVEGPHRAGLDEDVGDELAVAEFRGPVARRA